MNDHPSILDLELCRTGEADADVREHVAACAACQTRIAQLDAVADRLGDLPVPNPALFADVDRAVLAAIADRPRGRAPVLVFLRRHLIPAAAAALVLVGAFRFLDPRADSHRVARAPSQSQPDVNGDGRLDILDALALAQAVERGRPAVPAWDVNADGRVDAADADRVAQRVVTIGQGGTEG